MICDDVCFCKGKNNATIKQSSDERLLFFSRSMCIIQAVTWVGGIILTLGISFVFEEIL